MTAKRSHPRIPILLRLEPEELARIDEAAAIMDMNRSDFIRFYTGKIAKKLVVPLPLSGA